MSEQFEVGEIAIYWYPSSQYHQTEVTIVGPMECHQPGLFGYPIDCPTWPYNRQKSWVTISPDFMRKRRPPQDWKSLCHLTDTSVDKLEGVLA